MNVNGRCHKNPYRLNKKQEPDDPPPEQSIKHLCSALQVLEHCLKAGVCFNLEPDSQAWYELQVNCTRLFHESYQDLDDTFELLRAFCAEIHERLVSAYNEGITKGADLTTNQQVKK